MRILLVPPTHHYKKPNPECLSFSDFPSGFGYLSAVLKALGHEVIGLNPNNVIGYPSTKLMLADLLTKKLKETEPELVCFGGLCTDYSFLADAIRITRSVSKAPIVLGGQIVTNDAEFICSDLKPDIAIVGEAEEGIAWVATKISKGKVANKIVESAYVKNPDFIPFPDYEPFGIKDMLDNHSMDTRLLYRYSRPNPRPFNIVASRSCPFTCSFCIHGRRDAPYRARSIPNIMDEIKVMYEKYEFNVLILLDELFAVNKERMNEFSQAVIEGKDKYKWDFDWMFQTHANARFDNESLKLAKQAGCFFFSYGLESASPTVLKSMNKHLEVPQVIEAIKIAQDNKIGFGANLIFGDIAETQETWAESLAFWLKHAQDNFIFMSNLMPYPGSKLFNDCQTKGMFQDKHNFYEHIDEKVPNMTSIPDRIFNELLRITTYLETQWLFVKQALNVRGENSNIWATCPYCGEESLYRDRLDVTKPFRLGIGCTKCNRRINVGTDSGSI